MNKNHWSLTAFSEKAINRAILDLPERPHSEDQLSQLMLLRESHQKEKSKGPEPLLKVLNCRTTRPREQPACSLCSCCYESSSKLMACRICGCPTCRKCLLRERELKDETRALFCEKCDSEYLRAMQGIEHYNEVERLQTMLDRLVKEQEGIQQLVNQERAHQLTQGTQNSHIASRSAAIDRYTEENKILRHRCTQLSKKVDFGKNIGRDLRKRLRGLKKQVGESFGSVSNQSEELLERDDLSVSVDHRESVLTTNSEVREVGFEEPQRCKCVIY